MSKRKKYNPNKVTRAIYSKFQREQNVWKKVNVPYDMHMAFVVEHVNKLINEYVVEHELGEDEYTPDDVVVDVYEQQDLIIALKLSLICIPELWEVGIDSHFYNAETEDVLTIPFQLTIPPMSHFDLMQGCAVKVNRIGGLKTRWKGLQKEMIENWESEGIPDGYELIQSQASIRVHARFKNLNCYQKFNRCLSLRDNGELIEFLQSSEHLNNPAIPKPLIDFKKIENGSKAA